MPTNRGVGAHTLNNTILLTVLTCHKPTSPVK